MKAGVSRKGRRPFAALSRYASEFELAPDQQAAAVDPTASLTPSEFAVPSLDAMLTSAPEVRAASLASTLAALMLTIALLLALALTAWDSPQVSRPSNRAAVV